MVLTGVNPKLHNSVAVFWLLTVMTDHVNMQEAILAIGSASSPVEFKEAVLNGLFFSLTSVVSVLMIRQSS